MRLEPKAPPLLRSRAAAVFRRPWPPVGRFWLSWSFVLGLSGTSSAVEPQPDAAPQAPAVAPDPAPEATSAGAAAAVRRLRSARAGRAPGARDDVEQPAAPAATSSTAAPQAGRARSRRPRSKPARFAARHRNRVPSGRPAGRPEPALAGRLIPPRRAGRRELTVASRAARRSGPAGAADGERLAALGGHARVAGAAAVKRLVLAVAATLALAGVAQAARRRLLTYDCDPSPGRLRGLVPRAGRRSTWDWPTTHS